MKQLFYWLLSLLFVITGCEGRRDNAPTLAVYPFGDIYYSADGTISLGNNCRTGLKIKPYPSWLFWEATTDQVWCRVSKVYGMDSLTISVSANNEALERSATICVSSPSTEPIYIKVLQACVSRLDITPAEPQNVSEKGGEVEVHVKSDASWTVLTYSDWVLADVEKGTGDGVVRITVKPNPRKEADMARVSFSAAGVYRYLVINRASNPNGSYIYISPAKSQKVPKDGGTVSVEISTSEPWTASSDKSWAKVETKNGVGNGSTRIIVAENTNNDTQTARILFRAGAATASLEIVREYKSAPSYKYVKKGRTNEVAYTIDGNRILKGRSYDVAFTIDGNRILNGRSYDVAFTIDGNRILKGRSYDVAYTIDGRYIKEGRSSTVAFTVE